MERYVLHITKQCSMCCGYCYEQDKTSQYTWEEIKQTIDSIIEHNKEEFEIEFIGGEPMMAFNLIEKSVNYINEKATVPSYIITTNGTILNDDILKFLKQNQNIIMSISLDGTEKMNKDRIFKDGSPSYDIVVANAKELLSVIGHERVWIHMVAHMGNVHMLSQGVNHLYNMGFRLIDMGIYEGDKLKKSNLVYKRFEKIFLQQHIKISIDILSNRYPNLIYPLFNHNSYNDSKKYLKDNDGKVITETYGRVDNDITSLSTYDIIECVSEDYPKKLKNMVCFNHDTIKTRRYLWKKKF